jgi:ATP/maltotriose-dependent transcriptional regulator MalT
MGAVDDALARFEAVVGEARAELGPSHTRIVLAELDIARCLMLRGEYGRAGRMHVDLGGRIRAAFGGGSDPAAVLMRDEGLLDAMRGRLKDAEARLRQALEQFLRVAGPRNHRAPSFRLGLAEVLASRGRLDEAERLARETIALLPDPDVYPHIERARALTVLAKALRLAGRPGEAGVALAEARDVVRRTAGEQSPEMALVEAESRLVDPSPPVVASGRPVNGPHHEPERRSYRK